MKTKILLSLVILLVGRAGFCTTWTITAASSPLVFNPSAITIHSGDSIKFVLASMHDAVEVSQATWNANGNTPLPGFSVPFGGGLVLPSQLGMGMHYYVCSPHASFGMKGTINVVSSTGIDQPSFEANLFKLFPNPVSEKLNVNYSIQQSGHVEIKLSNITGKNSVILLSETKDTGDYNHSFNIDHNRFAKGVYIVELIIGDLRKTKKILIE